VRRLHLANIDTLLDATVTFIQGLSLSQPVTVSKAYLPKIELSEMSTTIRAYVLPKTQERDIINRSTYENDNSILIIVNKKVTTNDNSEIADMVTFIEEIATGFQGENIDTDGVVNVGIDPIYDFDKLSEQSIFQSLITIQVKGFS